MKKIISLVALSVLALSGCATSVQESHRVLEEPKVASYNTVYNGSKTTLVVGSVGNKSSYLQGLFTDTQNDQLGNQAKSILKTHLSQTNRFKLVDRESLESLKEEAAYLNTQLNVKGARYVVTGSVVEFGRKVNSDEQLFGVLGKGKKQIAYSKVSINVIDVKSSEVAFSTQGVGEYELSQREVLGFGTKAGYDSTLNGKVLNLALAEATNNLVRALESGQLQLEP